MFLPSCKPINPCEAIVYLVVFQPTKANRRHRTPAPESMLLFSIKITNPSATWQPVLKEETSPDTLCVGAFSGIWSKTNYVEMRGSRGICRTRTSLSSLLLAATPAHCSRFITWLFGIYWYRWESMLLVSKHSVHPDSNVHRSAREQRFKVADLSSWLHLSQTCNTNEKKMIMPLINRVRGTQIFSFTCLWWVQKSLFCFNASAVLEPTTTGSVEYQACFFRTSPTQ